MPFTISDILESSIVHFGFVLFLGTTHSEFKYFTDNVRCYDIQKHITLATIKNKNWEKNTNNNNNNKNPVKCSIKSLP